jgi:hypothetical protein
MECLTRDARRHTRGDTYEIHDHPAWRLPLQAGRQSAIQGTEYGGHATGTFYGDERQGEQYGDFLQATSGGTLKPSFDPDIIGGRVHTLTR